MNSYVARRRTSNGVLWFIVTPQRVEGKLRRVFDKCLGTIEETEAYLESIKDESEEGKSLYEKFLVYREGTEREFKKREWHNKRKKPTSGTV